MQKTNFLDKDYFETLKGVVFSNSIPWYKSNVNDFDNRKYFSHLLYEKTDISRWFVHFQKLIDKIGVKSIIRVKLNYYPSSDKLIKHAFHRDYDFSHKAAILSFNTCDGGTYIGNDFYSSEENKIIFFDGNHEHCSTNTTDKIGRCNININYF